METSAFILKDFKATIDTATFAWQTPSNIALVKYWGKSNPQIPKNASVSFTLNNCHTNTSVVFHKKAATGAITFDLFFDNKPKEAFKPKIATFLERIKDYCPYLLDYHLVINSDNSFPHSSGIASSASGLSAIAMCLISLEQQLVSGKSASYYTKKASFLARLGSGSASRSVEGPLVVWGKHPKVAGSSDVFGVPLSTDIHPIFKTYQDAILLVDKGEKQVSSTVGHNLMHQHPFAENRFLQANANLGTMLDVLKSGNLEQFISLVESEALTLHAMMLTSTPYFILMKPNTLEIINKIWAYRAAHNSAICFTLDAGANVHVLYPEAEKEAVNAFIDKELAPFCQNNQYILDAVGLGAKPLK